MTSPTFLDSLRARNPFADNAAANPWSRAFPDVPSINGKAFEEIARLISSKAGEPTQPLGGLILGEAGMGKTHLLRRILDHCRQSDPPALFVFVKPLFDPERPIHHLLQEIVLNLSKQTGGEHSFSQFERLVAEIIREYVRYRVTTRPGDDTPNNRCFLEKFEANVFHIFEKDVETGSMEIIDNEAVNYIHALVPETNRTFLDVIFQYKTFEKRGLVRDWIKGGTLDDENCAILGVPSRADFSKEAMEHEARDMLLSLGVLFERYRLPMVICFDQLDNLVAPALIAGFASMIHLLINDVSNMLPLAFIRGDSWNERFQKHPDRAFFDRLTHNTMPLTNCTREQARQLIIARIDGVFRPDDQDGESAKNWLLKQFDAKLDAETKISPREVIFLTNRIIRDSDQSTATLPKPSDGLAVEYKVAHETVASSFDNWDPDSEYLKEALELFLQNRENVVEFQKVNGRYANWTGRYHLETGEANVPFRFFINTAKHWQTVSAILGDAIGFLNKNKNSRCVYIADHRCNFSPTWKATNKKRQEFEQLGGTVLILEQSKAVRWYGLVALSLKIGSGDILLETEQGLRTATGKDLAAFLSTEFEPFEAEAGFDRLFGPFRAPTMDRTAGETIDVPPVVTPLDDNLTRLICECLESATYPLLALEILLQHLEGKGVQITPEACLEHIGKNSETIALIRSCQGVMVKLVL